MFRPPKVATPLTASMMVEPLSVPPGGLLPEGEIVTLTADVLDGVAVGILYRDGDRRHDRLTRDGGPGLLEEGELGSGSPGSRRQ